MSVVWIVTTGNSDVKLSSDYQWGSLREQKREQLKPCYNDFKVLIEDNDDDLFSLPARVLGIVYGEVLDTHWKYFRFPLLTEFVQAIQANKKNKPDRIIVLLTSQEEIFSEKNVVDSMYDSSDPDCPFWKDTNKLEPILQQYFDEEFGSGKVEFYSLEPKTIQEGLDNWDSTLRLVQQGFEEWGISKNDRVIVSHQAGTPAISSAVQLTALIKFRKKVSFLVGNEFIKGRASFLLGSSYFRTLQIKEALSLLQEFDYAGVKKTLNKIEFSADIKKRIDTLLEIADLWNTSRFEEFSQKLDSLETCSWAYEAAYLGFVRLRQENIMESFFHSFRAIEGLIKEWALREYHGQIQYSNRSQPNTPYLHDVNLPSKLTKWFNSTKNNSYHNIGLFGKPLFELFKQSYSSQEWDKHHCLKVLEKNILEERNSTFHGLRGLKKTDLFKIWLAKDEVGWESNIRGCLNFISGKSFSSLKEASLMAAVHEDLEDVINELLQE
jgi:hypothetical protein